MDAGETRRGHRVVAAALRSQPHRGRRAAGRVLDHPPICWLAAIEYALVARFRHRLPGGSGLCRMEQRDDG